MLAPITWRVPPRGYGPWEYVVSLLTEGLVAHGVDVTLFATADSLTSGRLSATVPRPLGEDGSLDVKVWESLHIASAVEQAVDFDIIHNHFDFLPLTYSRLMATPMVTTIHGFSSERIMPVYRRYNGRVHYVAISEADRAPDLDYAATIYHGIDVDRFAFRDRADPDGHLVFFGRIHPDKGLVEAIEVARLCGRDLVIAGIIHDDVYFREKVQPHLGPNVRYVGAVTQDRRDELLGSATALLHLVNFDEPFGLSMIEAMACGTPVVAMGRGAIPEVVDNGVTGEIVNTVDAAVAAVERVSELPRDAVRRQAARRFHRDRMVREYIDVYERILARRSAAPSIRSLGGGV